MDDQSAEGKRAFVFTGDWREFAPIAFTNLLLTIVTLGIYRFWAKTRVRRYLWSRTRLIDDRLEWTGTGMELFVGFLIAIVAFVVPLTVVNLLLQGVLLRGHQGAAILIGVVTYLAVIYLFGVAIFRALRYRLSRTFWHGIRGGSDDQGFGYGWQYFWRTIVGSMAAGLLIPWSMVRLWNRRWNAMSFGPLRFKADAQWGGIFTRFLLFYLVPVALVLFLITAFVFMFDPRAAGAPPSSGTVAAIVIGGLLFYIFFFGVLGLVAMIYYAAYYREVIGTLTLGELSFSFDARTIDWIKLYLGSLALVIVTLGIGAIFVPYRNWAFFIRHLEAHGTVHLDDLTRSQTREPGQGEGLLDAFDVGAF